MTGAAAGGTAAAGQGGDGDAQQQGGEGAGTGPDFAALSQMVSQQGETLEGMRDFLQSAPWQQIQQAAANGDPAGDPQGDPNDGLDLDLGFLDPSIAATMDPQQLEQRLQQTISDAADKIAERRVEQRVGPVEQQLTSLQRNAEVNALIGEFPELADAETAQPVLQAAAQLAEQMGQPELGNDPAFWRLTYMAGRAADAAQEEQGDIPAPATLESGAGATPGGGGADLGDQIVGARQGRGVLPFG